VRLCYVGLDLMLPALDSLIAQGVQIDRIFTCPVDNVYEFNTGIIDRAREYGIPYTTDRITREDVLKLRDSGCDGLVCGAYYYKIPVVPDFSMVNIHPSLLPVGRGPWPMPVTILKGLAESGVTVHKIEEGFDTGDVLMQEKFEVSPAEDLESFTEKFQSLLPGMMKTLVQDFQNLYDNAAPQGEGEYWAEPTEQDYTITADTAPSDCDRILRAFYGFPCVYDDGRKKYSIVRGRMSDRKGDCSISACGGYINAESITDIRETKI